MGQMEVESETTNLLSQIGINALISKNERSFIRSEVQDVKDVVLPELGLDDVGSFLERHGL